MSYFNAANTLEELRRQYKEFFKQFHPDNTGGSTEATQEINAEYDLLFRSEQPVLVAFVFWVRIQLAHETFHYGLLILLAAFD